MSKFNNNDAEKTSSSTVARCGGDGNNNNHHRHLAATAATATADGGSRIVMTTPYCLGPADHCFWLESPASLTMIAMVIMVTVVVIVVTVVVVLTIITPKTMPNVGGSTSTCTTNRSSSSSCSSPSPRNHPEDVPLEYNHNNMTMMVPFIVLRPPNGKKLHQTLVTFRQERHAALEQLSLHLEVALQSEQDHDANNYRDVPTRRRSRSRKQSPTTPISEPIRLSQSIQEHIDRLAAIYEQDLRILEQHILIPFSYIHVLPAPSRRRRRRDLSKPWNKDINDRDDTNEDDSLRPPQQANDSTRQISRIITRAVPNMPSYYYDNRDNNNNYYSGNETITPSDFAVQETAAVYDSVGQVVAHLVRDWSSEGQAIRSSLYSWCGDQVRQYVPPLGPRGRSQRSPHSSPATTTSSFLPVLLVPGAGLGRLAWELSQLDGGYAVQAVEPSGSMAAAAASMLACLRGSSEQALFRLHPYASDAFTNEVGR